MGRFFLGLIRVYQYCFSSFMGRSCRYHPTCSAYAAGSIRKFGAGRGMLMAVLRILRCHPWHPGGYDPVPETWADVKFYGREKTISSERN